LEKYRGRLFRFLLLALYGASACLGDTVSIITPNETFSPGTPTDALELSELGIDPNLFLFTANSMYGYNGTDQLDIVAAAVDPSQTSSLAGVTTQNVNVTLGSSDSSLSLTATQDSGSTPEPSTASLFALACLAILAIHVCRTGPSRSYSSTNSATESSSARRLRSGISLRTSREQNPPRLFRSVLRFCPKHAETNPRSPSTGNASSCVRGISRTTAESTLGGGLKAPGGTVERYSVVARNWHSTDRYP
jgi:hypothetical protein